MNGVYGERGNGGYLVVAFSLVVTFPVLWERGGNLGDFYLCIRSVSTGFFLTKHRYSLLAPRPGPGERRESISTPAR